MNSKVAANRIWLGLFVAVVLVFVAGCSGESSEKEVVESSPLASLADYYSQEVKWESCSDDLFIDSDYFADGFKKSDVVCGELRVPASYSDLSVGVFEIQLMKRESGKADASHLFINPGGPGGSGVQYLQFIQLSDEVKENFDVVGFDPRGVGFSDEIRCDDERDLKSFFQFDFYIDNEAEYLEAEKLSEEFIDDCIRDNPLWWSVNTENTVRDLDILRSSVGDDLLNYAGTSYGTTIGIEYVRLFGENAGKVIFDSVVENNVDKDAGILRDLESINGSLDRLFERCAEDTGCWGSTVEEVTANIKSAMVAADEGELTGVYGIENSEGYTNRTVGSAYLLFDGIFQMTYWPVDEIYGEFKAGMNELKEFDYPIFEWYGLTYNGYEPETKKRDNSAEILEIVNCLDVDSREFKTEAEILEFEDQIASVAPVYYELWRSDTEYLYIPEKQGCAWSWRAFDDPAIPDPPEKFLDPVNETGKEFLVVTSRLDNVTPYSGAVNTAKFLKSRLVVLEGDGHGMAFTGNECLDEVVSDYLIRDVLPQDGFSCE